jgi:acetoacetyl-CoA synthetase
LTSRVRKEIKKKASSRHIPALIIEVPDIAYTFNMKKSKAP